MAKVNKTFVDGQPLTAADMNAINSAAGAVGNATTTAELASVVAGNLALKDRDNSTSLDNAPFGIWWMAGTGNEGIPSELKETSQLHIVYTSPAIFTDNRAVQFCWGLADFKFGYRLKVGSSWTSWKIVSTN